jgi:nitrate reductase NapAB chaperone NapD
MMWIKRGDILFNTDEFKGIVADREDYRIKADTKDGKIIVLFKARSTESLMEIYDMIIDQISRGDTVIAFPLEDD